jgi:hypothetical protein
MASVPFPAREAADGGGKQLVSASFSDPQSRRFAPAAWWILDGVQFRTVHVQSMCSVVHLETMQCVAVQADIRGSGIYVRLY